LRPTMMRTVEVGGTEGCLKWKWLDCMTSSFGPNALHGRSGNEGLLTSAVLAWFTCAMMETYACSMLLLQYGAILLTGARLVGGWLLVPISNCAGCRHLPLNNIIYCTRCTGHRCTRQHQLVRRIGCRDGGSLRALLQRFSSCCYYVYEVLYSEDGTR